MSTAPQLGLNMHPNWLQGGPPESLLLPLWENGLRVLEFTLDLAAPDWPEFDDLIRACRALGFRLSFHAPGKGPYNPCGFSGPGRRSLEKLFAPVVAYAAAVARQQGRTILVVHGAKGQGPREALRRDTEAFLTWVGRQGADLCSALELRVREQGIAKIGDSKADLMEIVPGWGTPCGGICWDLGHDARNGSDPAPPGFVERVNHVHVHDLSPDGADHHPLLFDNVSYREHLRDLYQAGYSRAIILEVDGHIVARLARERETTAYRLLRESLHKMAEPFVARDS